MQDKHLLKLCGMMQMKHKGPKLNDKGSCSQQLLSGLQVAKQVSQLHAKAPPWDGHENIYTVHQINTEFIKDCRCLQDENACKTGPTALCLA